MSKEFGSAQSSREPRSDRDELQDRLEWQIAKQLLDAHTQTGRALERYLVLQTLRESPEEEGKEIEAAIEQAIDDHERIIESLEAARASVDTCNEELS